MLRLLADENFNGMLARGLLHLMPDLDLVRVQDVGLSACADPRILEWAASKGRILLTHDRQTIPRFAFERVARGEPMPGAFVVDDQMPPGQALDELQLAIRGGEPGEWAERVVYFPL